MGQILSIPVTDKKSEQQANDKFLCGVSEMQGWRITMEDAHTVILNLDQDSPDADGNAFFAVYDGHGGSAVARYAGQHVHKRLVQDEAYQKGDFPAALKNAFLGTDVDMRSSPDFVREVSGCTAVAGLVSSSGKIYVANAGDSRAVLSVRGEAVPLSHDHKPMDDTEYKRIRGAGGFIEYGRVNGNLALSRALGDFEYKKNTTLPAEKQIITSDPEIMDHEITEDAEFLIIACDGIWDCLSSQGVVNIVRLLISENKSLPNICEDICELCLAPDTTSGAEWYSEISARLKDGKGYPTPETLPQLYSTTRLSSFRAKRQAYENRQRMRQAERLERDARDRANGIEPRTPPIDSTARTLLGGLANILAGDVSPIIQSGPDRDDDSDDDSEEGGAESHGINARSLLSSAGFSLDQPLQYDATKSLRDQLQELDEMDSFNDHDVDMGETADNGLGRAGDAEGVHANEPDSPTYTFSGTTSAGKSRVETPPPPPTPPPNGDATPAQLKSLPEGDAPSAVAQVEGFLDASESPLKV